MPSTLLRLQVLDASKTRSHRTIQPVPKGRRLKRSLKLLGASRLILRLHKHLYRHSERETRNGPSTRHDLVKILKVVHRY